MLARAHHEDRSVSSSSRLRVRGGPDRQLGRRPGYARWHRTPHLFRSEAGGRPHHRPHPRHAVLYSIKESKGAADAFTLVGSMMDGRSERTVTYQGKLQGDELHLAAVGGTARPATTWWRIARPLAKAPIRSASSCPRCTRCRITASPKRRPWVGTVGTNSTAAWTTPPCAAWPTPSRPTA